MTITVSAVGRLTRDPDISEKDGKRRARFGLACNRKRQGEEYTSFLNCTAVADGLVTVIANWTGKGKQVFVSGELTLRGYTANDGTAKVSADVFIDRLVLVGGKDDRDAQQRRSLSTDEIARAGYADDREVVTPRQSAAAIEAQRPSANKRSSPELNDEIPF